MTSLTLSAGAHAFGDGTHPTTRGVLEVLSGIDPALFAPRNALDMGAGSGILSFAILEKFGCPVLAVDVEESAVEAIKANARANGVAVRGSALQEIPGQARDDSPAVSALRADGFDHPAIHGSYDLITMNILAEPLLKLARDAEAHLAPEGLLITSGILQWQEGQIREAYQVLGLELSARIVIGDWVTLAWQKG